jgi:hypothetical protein
MHTAAQRGDRRDLAACDDSLEIGTAVDLGDLDLLPLQPTESHEHMDKIHIHRLAGVRGDDPEHQPAPTRAEPPASLLMRTAAQRGDRRDLAACDDSLEIGTAVDLGDLDLLPLQPTESHEHMDAVAAPGIGADIVAATDGSVEVEPLALAEYVEQLDDLSHLPRLAETTKQTTDMCCPYCDNVATISSNVLKYARKTNEIGKWWVGNAIHTRCLRLMWPIL